MNKTPYKILLDKDLSETQIYATIQTYDRFSKEYADKWEWNPITVKEIQKYNIKPFLKYAKINGKVLIVGCQTGRDYSLLTKAGFSCLGVEFSYGLLSEALRRVPEGIFIHLFPQSLPFMPGSFDAVYADALTIVPKRYIKDILKDFRIFLKRKGLLYLSLKLGDANVIVIEDLGGKRYCTLYRKEEVLRLIEIAGFDLAWSQESKNTDPTLPKWFSLIAIKK